jgi:hypothetical protein
MSDTDTDTEMEEGPIEERLRQAIDEYREVANDDYGYEDGLQIIVDERRDTLQDLVVEAEETNPAAGTELSILIGEANELLEETPQGGKRRRRKTKKSKGKSKKSKSKKSKARKTRRRLL